MNTKSSILPNEKEIQRISELIDCPVDVVRHCMLQIGPSVPAISAYWQMNKDRLLYEIAQKQDHQKPKLP